MIYRLEFMNTITSIMYHVWQWHVVAYRLRSTEVCSSYRIMGHYMHANREGSHSDWVSSCYLFLETRGRTTWLLHLGKPLNRNESLMFRNGSV